LPMRRGFSSDDTCPNQRRSSDDIYPIRDDQRRSSDDIFRGDRHCLLHYPTPTSEVFTKNSDDSGDICPYLSFCKRTKKENNILLFCACIGLGTNIATIVTAKHYAQPTLWPKHRGIAANITPTALARGIMGRAKQSRNRHRAA
jgi:hypothetical protein